MSFSKETNVLKYGSMGSRPSFKLIANLSFDNTFSILNVAYSQKCKFRY